MKSAFVFLSVLTTAAADDGGFNMVKYPWAKSRKARCVVNIMDATNEIFDAGIYSWGSAQRCTSDANNNLHCVVDLLATVASVTRMVEYTLKAINHCDPHGRNTNYQCAQAGLKLTAGLTALGSASAKITTQCPNQVQPVSDGPALEFNARDRLAMGVCVLSIKEGVKHLAKAAAVFTKDKVKCSPKAETWQCADMSFTFAEHLVNVGKYILSAVSRCDINANIAGQGKHCGIAATAVVAALAEIGGASSELAGYCGKKDHSRRRRPHVQAVNTVTVTYLVNAVPARLYSEDADDGDAPSLATPLNGILLAMLPIAIVGGFVGGSRFQRRSARRTRVAPPMSEPIE